MHGFRAVPIGMHYEMFNCILRCTIIILRDCELYYNIATRSTPCSSLGFSHSCVWVSSPSRMIPVCTTGEKSRNGPPLPSLMTNMAFICPRTKPIASLKATKSSLRKNNTVILTQFPFSAIILPAVTANSHYHHPSG